MGFGPSLNIARHQFAGYGKDDFDCSADTELPDSVRSLQLGIGGLNARTDFVTFFPLCLFADRHTSDLAIAIPR